MQSGLDCTGLAGQVASVDQETIKRALGEISSEQDPTTKSFRVASICSAIWAEHGVQLVVVGGSAIEFLTDGTYASGDVDMCHATQATLPLRLRQEIMGRLGATGGPRNWQVEGIYLDLLGPVESFARTPLRQLDAPYGPVLIMKPEDLLVERVLVSVYPQPDERAKNCAKALIAVVLRHQVELDWEEVKRVANLPEYRNLPECQALVREVADELKIPSPLHPD